MSEIYTLGVRGYYNLLICVTLLPLYTHAKHDTLVLLFYYIGFYC